MVQNLFNYNGLIFDIHYPNALRSSPEHKFLTLTNNAHHFIINLKDDQIVLNPSCFYHEIITGCGDKFYIANGNGMEVWGFDGPSQALIINGFIILSSKLLYKDSSSPWNCRPTEVGWWAFRVF